MSGIVLTTLQRRLSYSIIIITLRCRYYHPHLQMWKLRPGKLHNVLKVTQLLRNTIEILIRAVRFMTWSLNNHARLCSYNSVAAFISVSICNLGESICKGKSPGLCNLALHWSSKSCVAQVTANLYPEA